MKSLPQDLESERCVLACCVLVQTLIDDISLVVKSEMFFAASHRQIFDAIQAMHSRSTGIDAVTLARALQERGQLEEIGGAAYLNTIMQTVPHAAHWKHYCELVRDRWLRRRCVEMGSQVVEAGFDETENSEHAIAQAERLLSNLIEDVDGHDQVKEIAEVLQSVFGELDRERDEGLFTGIDPLDRITDGFRPGELVILAARPSVGKTALALNFLERWGRNDQPILFFSAEQSQLEICERLLSLHMNVSMHSLRERTTDPLSEEACASAMHDWPVFIDDRPNPQILKIESQSRLCKRRKNIQAVIIDYLQLIEPADQRIPREQQVATISRQLKGLAKSLKVPVIVLAQLNRQVESRGGEGEDHGRPRLSDLRESGSLEQDADKVLLMWRPFKDDKPTNGEPDKRNLTLVEVAKNRNGPTGLAKLSFAAESFRFAEHFEGAIGPHVYADAFD